MGPDRTHHQAAQSGIGSLVVPGCRSASTAWLPRHCSRRSAASAFLLHAFQVRQSALLDQLDARSERNRERLNEAGGFLNPLKAPLAMDRVMAAWISEWISLRVRSWVFWNRRRKRSSCKKHHTAAKSADRKSLHAIPVALIITDINRQGHDGNWRCDA